MIVHLKGVVATGAGFQDWTALCDHWCRGVPLDPDFIPDPRPTVLPGAEGRRATATVRLAVSLAEAVQRQTRLAPENLALVFASTFGDADTVDQICTALAEPGRFVSPTRFHNSVHNAAAGYWSIATGSRLPSTSLSAWNDTFPAALLEAASQALAERVDVLLAVYDHPCPAPLADAVPNHPPFGMAVVLSAEPMGSLARLQINLEVAQGTPTPFPDESLLAVYPPRSSASRALTLLSALARREAGPQEVRLDYLDALQLRIRIDTAATAVTAGAPGSPASDGCA